MFSMCTEMVCVKTVDHKVNMHFDLELISTLDIPSPLYKGFGQDFQKGYIKSERYKTYVVLFKSVQRQLRELWSITLRFRGENSERENLPFPLFLTYIYSNSTLSYYYLMYYYLLHW